MAVKIKKPKLCHKKKLNFEYYKNCLEATQLENKKNEVEKNKVNVSSSKESHKEFIKNNKLILKAQKRFKSKKIDVN